MTEETYNDFLKDAGLVNSTIFRRGNKVGVICDNEEDAVGVFEWIKSIKSKIKVKK